MASQGSSSTLPVVPWNDWEIDPAEIEILKHSDGRDWKLGTGAMGTVRIILEGSLNPSI